MATVIAETIPFEQTAKLLLVKFLDVDGTVWTVNAAAFIEAAEGEYNGDRTEVHLCTFGTPEGASITVHLPVWLRIKELLGKEHDLTKEVQPLIEDRPGRVPRAGR